MHKEVRAAQTIQKYRKGDSLTDGEIKDALDVLPVIIGFLDAASLEYEYRLVTNNLKRILYDFEDFQQQRRG